MDKKMNAIVISVLSLTLLMGCAMGNGGNKSLGMDSASSMELTQEQVDGKSSADASNSSDMSVQASETFSEAAESNALKSSEDSQKESDGQDMDGTESSDTIKESVAEGERDSKNSDDLVRSIKTPAAESVSGGMKYTFTDLPQNAEELKQIADFKDGRYVMALFMASLVRFVENKDDGIAMINVLRGPQPMSNHEISFLNDRFMDKKYLAMAYFEGANPDNNYTPNEPWTVLIFDDLREPDEEGYMRTFIATTGADSTRYIKLRQKNEDWFVWEYSSVVTGIRLPKDEDVWR